MMHTIAPLLSASGASHLGMAPLAGVSPANIVLATIVLLLLFFGRPVADALPTIVANLRRIWHGRIPVDAPKHVHVEVRCREQLLRQHRNC